MAGDEGRVRPPADFDPRVRLGWSEEGLLVLATVRDNVPVESDSDRDLWAADSVELFLARTPVVANDY